MEVDTVTADQIRKIIHSELLTIKAEVSSTRDEVYEIRRIVKGDGNGLRGFGEQIRDNRADIEIVKTRQEEYKNFIKELQPFIIFSKVGIWAGSAFGALLIAFIWAILTHQINISYSP